MKYTLPHTPMRSKRFNHFIVAGVFAMASAGLVTAHGSLRAQSTELPATDYLYPTIEQTTPARSVPPMRSVPPGDMQFMQRMGMPMPVRQPNMQPSGEMRFQQIDPANSMRMHNGMTTERMNTHPAAPFGTMENRQIPTTMQMQHPGMMRQEQGMSAPAGMGQDMGQGMERGMGMPHMGGSNIDRLLNLQLDTDGEELSAEQIKKLELKKAALEKALNKIDKDVEKMIKRATKKDEKATKIFEKRLAMAEKKLAAATTDEQTAQWTAIIEQLQAAMEDRPSLEEHLEMIREDAAEKKEAIEEAIDEINEYLNADAE